MRPQEQPAQIAMFGLSVVFLGMVTTTLRDMARGTLAGDKSPALLPAVSHTYTSGEIFTRAKKYFGTTSYPDEAGYILPDGAMLDFGAVKWGGGPGERIKDHTEITFAWPPWEEIGGFEAMKQAMNWGAVRFACLGHMIIVNLVRMPTIAQQQQIKRALRRYPDAVLIIEIDDEALNQIASRNFTCPFTNWLAFAGEATGQKEPVKGEHVPMAKKHKDRRTAYYVQYWLTRTGRKEDGEPYHWNGPEDQGAFKTLDDALRSASLELKRQEPGAYDIDIYSREEKWIPDEEYPWYGVWEQVEDTMKIYDPRGAVVWDAKTYLPHSVPVNDLKSIADKYGWWAARLAESLCPHNDVACVEREAKRLVNARASRY